MVLRLGLLCLIPFSDALTQSAAPVGQARPVAQLSRFPADKAVRLMRERLPCAGCHTFAGGGGRVGPDLSRVADRRTASYVRRMIEDPQGTVPGTPMPKVPMPSATRALIIAYLTARAVHNDAAQSAPPTLARDASRTDAGTSAPLLYRRYCAACHGSAGRGDGPNARFLPVRPAVHADAAYMSARSDDRLFDAIYAGGYPLGRSVTMPPFGETLSRSEIWSLVRHLRQLCRCVGPAWSVQPRQRAPGRSP